MEPSKDLTIHIAQLLRERNNIDRQISKVIGRPATQGHIGEFIASRIFDIELMSRANNRAIDGFFRSGAIAGKSVDVKMYGKQEGILALNEGVQPDYFLVMTGPKAVAMSSKGTVRLCVIEHVYLFDGKAIAADLGSRGVRFGVAASVKGALWEAAEIYPSPRNATLVLSQEQHSLLQLFCGE
ncbi:MAG: hypothetical protein WD872_05230 [Pirellulaceae bacterium]